MMNYNTEKVYGYIYCITNSINLKQYVGLTTRSVEQRFREHCKADTYIGNAIRKYGVENFILETVDIAIDKQGLIKKEMEWIKELETFGKGYNKTNGGDGVDNVVLLEVNLSEREQKYVNFVRAENKKDIDTSDKVQLMSSVIKNLLEIYLIAKRLTDKKQAARLILRLKPTYLKAVMELELLDIREVKSYAFSK